MAPSNMNNVTAADYMPKKAATGFECSMDGYKSLVIEFIDLLIIAIPMAKEMFKLVMPYDLKMAIDHLYLGLTGANAWIGYAIAALYYIAVDQGYGDQMCEASGYLGVVVETLHMVVEFDPKAQAKA